ncbi:MAG TPA: oxygen-independent coproporphyrinogen III oxidase [Hyphomicrobiaceae bacterium]|nr:oxygen-independent coproporphyrinogen III oxidase [Hyphomicrobiaceae bacterium]
MHTPLTPEAIERLAAPVPRYTSYPTAPHFSGAIDARAYAGWLESLPADASLSLYLHIPYCQTLCWYCGCNTKATQRYQPVSTYLQALRREIGAVARLLPAVHGVAHIHFGGGSPNIVGAADFETLVAQLRREFTVAADAEIAVEIDPRHCNDGYAAALQRAGITRVSIGVQDFDPEVQAAINRIQSFEATARVVRDLRAHGIGSLNIDLVYGLPRQTFERLDRTLSDVLKLAPDRIAVFGYAHLPERLTHQRLIDSTTVPGAVERHAFAAHIADRIEAGGYQRIGLDHFARQHDALAKQPVKRNFQGYTIDAADALIGLGASAIGRLPQGYVQNATATGDYQRRVHETGLAAVRGIALSADDRLRASVIERLMCSFELKTSELEREFGSSARPILAEAEALLARDGDGIVERADDGFRITPAGRPFVRSVCAHFDAYLGRGSTRFSTGI